MLNFIEKIMNKKILLIAVIVLVSAAGFINSYIVTSNKPKDYVVVYYFHGDYRCQTCITIESYIKEAVEQYYATEVEEGSVQLKVINFDKKKNKAFIDKYKLFNQAMIVSRYANDKEVEWKDCPKIWEIVSNRSKFFSYVKKEVDKYLKAK